MATQLIPHDAPTNIALIVEHTPQIVLLEPAKYDALYEHMKAETDAFAPDVTSDKGRKACAAMAFKVTKTKTAIDNARKALTAEWRTQTAQVNEVGAKIAADLTELAKEVRKPLTDWEAAEDARKLRCDSAIAKLAQDAIVTIEDTAATVRARGFEIHEMVLDAAEYSDQLAQAQAAKDHAVTVLRAALARLTEDEAAKAKAAADLAELEQLRVEFAKREAQEFADIAILQAKEAAEQEARDAAELAAAKAKADEDRRAAALVAEQERIAQAAQEAADRAKRDAEEAAQAARDEVQREHEQAIDAAWARAADAENAAQAEIARLAKIEADRVSKEQADAADKALREADQDHRTAVRTAAKLALMSCGADEETARKIVLAIQAGEVPAVRLEF